MRVLFGKSERRKRPVAIPTTSSIARAGNGSERTGRVKAAPKLSSVVRGESSEEERDVATFSPPEIATPNRAPHLSTTLISAGVAVALLYYGRDFFVTLITGATLGFLLEPFVE